MADFVGVIPLVSVRRRNTKELYTEVPRRYVTVVVTMSSRFAQHPHLSITDKQGKGPATPYNRPPPGGNFTEAPPPPAVDEDASPAPSTSAIHPSRLQIIESAPPAHAYGKPSSFRGGAGGRGGRGGFAPPAAPRGGRGFGRAAGVTGENRVAPPSGMRSWGSTPLGGSPAPESASAPAASVPVQVNGNANANGAEKKKKGKKGDKGGTGSKAGIKSTHNQILANGGGGETKLVAPAPPAPAPATTNGDEPSGKKRKRDIESESAPAPAPTTQIVSPTTTTSTGPSEKTLKRLRKNLSKLDSSDKETITLSEYLGRVGKGKKDESIDREEVLAGLKVGLEGGKWVLSV